MDTTSTSYAVKAAADNIAEVFMQDELKCIISYSLDTPEQSQLPEIKSYTNTMLVAACTEKYLTWEMKVCF